MTPHSWPDWAAAPLAAPFRSLAPLLERLPADRWPTDADWTVLARKGQLSNAQGQALRFVPASGERMAALQFERRIFERGEVETRARNWHDAFHACAWLRFPRTKARINALHVAEGTAGAANGRSPLRDQLTLFDESGVVVACAQDALADLLRGFQWHALFWEQRAAVARSMDFEIFGHALFEHALDWRDGITGKALVAAVDAGYFDLDAPARLTQLDAALERFFLDQARSRGPGALQPLPLKGIPGWAMENRSEAYYRDERQFRPGRTRRPTTAR